MAIASRAIVVASWLVVMACGSGEAPSSTVASATSVPAAASGLPSAAPAAAPVASSPKDALRRGRQLAKDGQWKEAAAAFRAATEASPDDALLLSELGWALLNAGDQRASAEASQHALEVVTEPRLKAQIFYNLGRALEAQDDRAGAKKRYEESLALRSNRTVEARLEALGGAKPKVGPQRKGLACARGFPNTQALCDCLLGEKSALALFGDDDKITCGVDAGSPRGAGDELQILRWGAASADAGESVLLLTANTAGGVMPVAELGRDYDPGTFGVKNAIKVLGIEQKTVGEREVAIVKAEQRDSDASTGGLEVLTTRTLRATVCTLRDDTHPTVCPFALPLEIDESLHYVDDKTASPSDLAYAEAHRSGAYDRALRFDLSLADGRATLKQTKGSEEWAPKGALGKHPIW